MTTFLEGIEQGLPDGERLLWQGRPTRAAMARYAFHVRKIAIYFGLLIVIAAIAVRGDATPVASFLSNALWLAIGGGVAIMFASVIATLSARTTLYAITERRVVMKVGIALPVVLNIPLRVIDSVAAKTYADGSGNLALHLANESRVAYIVLWPHARAWKLKYPEPLLRGLVDVHGVATILDNALRTQMATDDAVAELMGTGATVSVGMPAAAHAVLPATAGAAAVSSFTSGHAA